VFTDDIAAPEETTDEAVRADYEATLAAVVEAEGVDAVAADSGVDSEVLDALAAGSRPTRASPARCSTRSPRASRRS